jgi:hypothetical protein
MGVVPHALSSCLLQDLSEQIPSSSLERIKNGDGLWPGISFKEAASLSIHNSLLKKLETGMTKETKAAALKKFLQVDSECKSWELQFKNFGDDLLFGEFKQLLNKFWFPRLQPIVDHDYDCLFRGRLGPGSAIGARGGDFYTKLFSSELTCTGLNLYSMYRRYIRSFPEWYNAEAIRLANLGEAKVVEGNRLDFVPKNDDISRSICVEPTLNMFFQLGFAAILNSRLKDFTGIDLENQQFKNRELARIGSFDESFATIDLSSASDSISLRMLEVSLPAGFLAFLKRYRCARSRLPDGTLHELGMVSTMGNGYTFSLQTVLFTCVVLAAFRLSGMAPRMPRGVEVGNFGVNGDDIVVPTAIAPKVLQLLRLLGFTPNASKTFVEGPFRESCGGDFFQGRNLRGVYVKRLSSPQDLYSAINQLNLFSTRTGLTLKHTVKYLLARVKWLPVPCWENDDAGIRMPISLLRTPYHLDRDTQSLVYYAWKPAQLAKIRIMDSALVIPRSLKRRIFNPSGLHISFLQGSVNSYVISTRASEILYRRKRCIAPNWDTPPAIHPLAGWFNWRRWNTATYINLLG